MVDFVTFCFIPTLMIWGLMKIKKTTTKFKLFEYILCFILVCFLYLIFFE